MNLGSLPEANGYDASSDKEIAATGMVLISRVLTILWEGHNHL